MIAGHWSVVVVGARIAGASTAYALAPYVESVLVVDASQPTAFWPQQSTWDRQGNLLWAELGLLDTVLACGAPRTYGHTHRIDGDVVERDYPQVDGYAFRMSVPREVLDPALLRAARRRRNVTVVRPARVGGIVAGGGRIRGATVRHDGVDHAVTCDLLVLADGRRSRNAERLGAKPYTTIASPWFALLVYYEDLPVPADRGYFSLQGNGLLICTPCGAGQWCLSSGLHASLVDATGPHPVQAFRRLLDGDPHLGPAVAAGRPVTPVGGAGKLRMLRRPMSGPGWCLVGDAGYHLDPVTALGTCAALTSVRLLRDRVAAAGVEGADLDGLTAERDATLDDEWTQTAQIVSG